jgi:two-component system response regulator ChvI
MTFHTKTIAADPAGDIIRLVLLGPASAATARVRELVRFEARGAQQVQGAEAAAQALRGGDIAAAAVVLADRPDEMLAQLQALRGRTEKPIIVFAADPQALPGMLALQFGADAVLADSAADSFVQASVRALLRRLQAYRDLGRGPREKLDRGPLQLDLTCHLATWQGQDVRLTATEFTLLHLLAERPMHIRTREHLQDALYGNRIFVDDRTIDSHVKRLRKKLRAVDPGFDAIDTVYGVGYRFRLPVAPLVRARPQLHSVS